MFRQVVSITALAVVTIGFRPACHAIDVTPTDGGGPTPQMLAESIADFSSGVTVVAASAVTTINNSIQGDPSSDPRAMGSFTSGITAPGTLLPAANQNMAGDASYAGGIDIDSGVCLCTGVVSDSLATAAPGIAGVFTRCFYGGGGNLLDNAKKKMSKLTFL